MKNPPSRKKLYYFIDLDLPSLRVIGWGIESRDKVEVNLTGACHRVFLSKGQYNKFERKLAAGRTQMRPEKSEI
jgi:hypothetical protein